MYIANLAITAAVANNTNLGFICMTLGAVCDKAKNLYIANCIDMYQLVASVAMPICRCAIVRKYVRIRISPKLIFGLVIIAVGTLVSYYINVLRLNTITLAAVSIFVFLRFGNELSGFLGHEEQWSMVCDNLFQINNALVIAFIVGIFAEGGLKYQGRNLKTISKHMLGLFMFNMIAMALFPVFGEFYFSVAISCFTGNSIELVSVSKNIIGAIK